jgi:hypothetical protein
VRRALTFLVMFSSFSYHLSESGSCGSRTSLSQRGLKQIHHRKSWCPVVALGWNQRWACAHSLDSAAGVANRKHELSHVLYPHRRTQHTLTTAHCTTGPRSVLDTNNQESPLPTLAHLIRIGLGLLCG